MTIPANISIYNELKRKIIEMEYLPGELLREKDLIEAFNVSRTPVREAILKLAQIGLVEIKPRIGTYVSQIDLSSVKQAYEIKKNLEGLAAQLAAQRATDAEITQLYDVLNRFNNYDFIQDYKECIKDDQRFHRIIRLATKNDILIQILDELNIKTARFLQHIHYVLDDYDWFIASLQEIADAIKHHRADLARIATETHTDKFLIQLSQTFFR